MSVMKLLPAIFLALGIAIAGFFVQNGILQSKKFNQFVTMRGLAEKMVESNEASWSVQFSATGNDFARVNEKIRKDQERVLKFFSKNGFQDQEVEKNPVNVVDRRADAYSSNTNSDRYIIRSGFVISSKRVRELAALSAKLDELLIQGIVVTSSSLRYYFTDLNNIKPLMLKEAINNARDAAKSFAEDSGAALGGIRNANQGAFSIGSAYSDYDNESTFLKKVRVVSNVEFFLK